MSPASSLPKAAPFTNYAKYCGSCGAGLVASAVVCPSCGSAQAGFSTTSNKSKTVAVLLAVFLTGWSWLYTYQRNSKKFFIFLGCFVLEIILYAVAFSSVAHLTYTCNANNTNCSFHNTGGAGGAAIVAWLIAFGMWVWAIVDNSTKSQQWYANFPNG